MARSYLSETETGDTARRLWENSARPAAGLGGCTVAVAHPHRAAEQWRAFICSDRLTMTSSVFEDATLIAKWRLDRSLSRGTVGQFPTRQRGLNSRRKGLSE